MPDPRVDPIRMRPRAFGLLRRALEEEHATLLGDIAALDDQVDALRRRRHDAVRRCREITATLAPAYRRSGRRPGDDGLEQLPPAAPNAVALYGARLRSTCRELLRERGELELRALHELLHLRGYLVGGETPVRALADALAYEVRRGRVRRVRRGTYALTPG